MNARKIGLFIAAFVFVLIVAFLLTQAVSNAPSLDALFTLPTFPGLFAVNLLVGVSLVLFYRESGNGGTLRIVLTVVFALAIGFVVLMFISPDPVKAFVALLTGPIQRVNRWGNWIEDSLSLILVGLAIAIVFRARLFSLGAEGQMLLSAAAAGLVVLNVKGLPQGILIPLAVTVACAAAFLWGLLPGALRAYLGANELVSTLMLNEIAGRIYSLILQAIKPPNVGYIVSAPFPPEGVFPRFITGTRISTEVLYVVVAVIAGWLLIQRTPFGYTIRMIGANPNFARYGGIKTRQVIMLTMAVSGIFAGLAGAYLAMSVNQRLIASISGGLAFEGIVVALLARNKVLAVPAMGLLYAYLRAGGAIIQIDAKVPLEIVNIIQAIIILLITADAVANFMKLRRRNVQEA